jgi:hypothetical protein
LVSLRSTDTDRQTGFTYKASADYRKGYCAQALFSPAGNAVSTGCSFIKKAFRIDLQEIVRLNGLALIDKHGEPLVKVSKDNDPSSQTKDPHHVARDETGACHRRRNIEMFTENNSEEATWNSRHQNNRAGQFKR